MVIFFFLLKFVQYLLVLGEHKFGSFLLDEMVWISVDSWTNVYCTTINYQENKLEASVLCRDDRLWILYLVVIYVFFCVNEHLYI